MSGVRKDENQSDFDNWNNSIVQSVSTEDKQSPNLNEANLHMTVKTVKILWHGLLPSAFPFAY